MRLNKEEIFNRESEDRNMNFVREQNATRAAMQDDLQIDMFNERQKDLVIWQQDIAEETLQQLAHELRNEWYDPKTESWNKRLLLTLPSGKKIYMQPLLNEVGIQSIISLVRPLLSRNMINTNLDGDQISKMLVRTIITTILNLGHEYDSWGLGIDPKISTLDRIVDLVQNYIMPTPYRALHDGERRHLRSFSRRIETLSEAPPPSKGTRKWGFF